MLTEFGAGDQVYQLRKKISMITSELKAMGDPPLPKPELIDSANMLRSNEFFSKAYFKQNELILAYSDYAKALEKILSDVFEIQNDLKSILKEQTKLLSSRTTKKRKRLR